MKTGLIGNCSACDGGALFREGYLKNVEHRGVKGKIRHFKNTCNNCRIQLFDEDCSRENRRSWVVFQKEVEGVPTGPQIKKLRTSLHLTSEQAGSLLGGGPKAFSKYENEEIVPQGAMRTLLVTLIKFPQVVELIKQAKGLSPTREPSVPKAAQPLNAVWLELDTLVMPAISEGLGQMVHFGGNVWSYQQARQMVAKETMPSPEQTIELFSGSAPATAHALGRSVPLKHRRARTIGFPRYGV